MPAEPVAALLDQVIVMCHLRALNHIVYSCGVSWYCGLLSTEWVLDLNVLIPVQSIVCILEWDFYFFSSNYYFFHFSSIVSAGPELPPRAGGYFGKFNHRKNIKRGKIPLYPRAWRLSTIKFFSCTLLGGPTRLRTYSSFLFFFRSSTLRPACFILIARATGLLAIN